MAGIQYIILVPRRKVSGFEIVGPGLCIGSDGQNGKQYQEGGKVKHHALKLILVVFELDRVNE
jgi:hypothetical protein